MSAQPIPAPLPATFANTDEQLSGRQYALLQRAFDFFNARLFAGELPQVLITLGRYKKSMGCFSPERFTLNNAKGVIAPREAEQGELCSSLRSIQADKIIHEIALNPDFFLQELPENEALQTLAHEMAHLWQEAFGLKKPRKCYHNKEWADKMEEIGLMPSSTGQKGGKRTGQKMGDYIIEGGPFAIACERFREKAGDPLLINAVPRLTAATSVEKQKKKACFECNICKQKAWAKPTATLVCGDCKIPMMSNDPAVE